MPDESYAPVERGEETEGPSLTSLLRILRRWRAPFYVLALGLPVATAVVLLLTPNKFTASGTILVETPEGGILGSDLLAQFTNITGIAAQVPPTDMYLAILRSDRVAMAIAESLALADYYEVDGKDAGERMEKTLTRLGKRSSIDSPDQVTIHVAATDKDPQMATDIVNGYLNELDRASQYLVLSRAGRTRKMVEATLLDAQADLDSARARLQTFQEKYGVFEIEKQAEGALELIGGLQAELVQAQTERSTLRSYTIEGSSQLKALDLKIAALQEEIRKLRGMQLVARPGTGGIFVPMSELPALAGEYARLFGDLKVQEGKHNVLATQLEQTKIEESQSIPAFEILDWGKRPYKKSGPFRTMLTLAALAAGVLGGVLLAILLDDLDRRVSPEARREFLALVPSFLLAPANRLARRGSRGRAVQRG